MLGDNQELLRALQALKDSPAYNVKAIAFWLRDLELSNYTQTFAKVLQGITVGSLSDVQNLMVNFIESLTILTDHTINRLVPTVIPDRNKLKTAVREMKVLHEISHTRSVLNTTLGVSLLLHGDSSAS